jgi:hypothetical protein
MIVPRDPEEIVSGLEAMTVEVGGKDAVRIWSE